jgi:hypothetical protein
MAAIQTNRELTEFPPAAQLMSIALRVGRFSRTRRKRSTCSVRRTRTTTTVPRATSVGGCSGSVKRKSGIVKSVWRIVSSSKYGYYMPTSVETASC